MGAYFKSSPLVARTLCRQGQAEKIVPVEIYNPCDEPVHLYKRTTLGIATPIDEVTNVQIETTKDVSIEKVGQVKVVCRTEASLPEEIQKLVDEMTEVLVPEDVQKFGCLVREYRDVFSTKDEPLGQTDVVEHEIKTTGPPIKMHYRRVPSGLKERL